MPMTEHDSILGYVNSNKLLCLAHGAKHAEKQTTNKLTWVLFVKLKRADTNAVPGCANVHL